MSLSALHKGIFKHQTIKQILSNHHKNNNISNRDPNNSNNNHNQSLTHNYDNTNLISVSGWVRSIRNHKNHTFIELCDGTSIKPLQAIITNNNNTPYHLSNNKNINNISFNANMITTGTSLKLTGKLVNSPGKNQEKELSVDHLTIMGTCSSETYPLAKSRLPFDFLRSNLHLRPRSKTFSALWRLRSRLMKEIHCYFESHDFLLVQTPILTSLDCEGAGEVFEVRTFEEEGENQSVDDKNDPTPTNELNNTTINGNPSSINTDNMIFNDDQKTTRSPSLFFGKPVYLTVSGQLHLESMASSHSRVYTLNPAFRAEKSNTSRHLAEFYMLEAEISFLEDLPTLMDFIEDMLKVTTMRLMKQNEEEFKFFNQWIDKGLHERLQVLVNEPFGRLSYTDAIQELQTVKHKKWEFPLKWGLPLQSEHEKYLAEDIFKKPVFVTDYPQKMKPFYMKMNGRDHPDNYVDNNITNNSNINNRGNTVACLDLLVPRVGELVGGSLREDCVSRLQDAIVKEHGLSLKEYEWYLDLRRYGGTPHGGFGLGFERYLQYLTGISTVKDLIYMPRSYANCDF